MFGIGSPDVDLEAYSNTFVSFLGMDSKSWGLSYRGAFKHNGREIMMPEHTFSRGDLVGCLLDLWNCQVTFIINRKAVMDSM